MNQDSYRKLLNELKYFNLEYRLYTLIDTYKLIIINNNEDKIIIYYKMNNSINALLKVIINSDNILTIDNHYIQDYILNKSIIFNDMSIFNIHKDIDKIIQFNKKKTLLKKIIDKYSNESMDYLYYYLF